MTKIYNTTISLSSSISNNITNLISQYNLPNPTHYPTNSIYLYIHIITTTSFSPLTHTLTSTNTFHLYNPHNQIINNFSSFTKLIYHINNHYSQYHTYLTPTHQSFNSLINTLQTTHSNLSNINTIHHSSISNIIYKSTPNISLPSNYNPTKTTSIPNNTSTFNTNFKPTSSTITIYLNQPTTHTFFTNKLLSLTHQHLPTTI